LGSRADFYVLEKKLCRPRLEWEEYVQGLARTGGRKLPEVKIMAQNRREYGK
jgi:hypothetical protein